MKTRFTFPPKEDTAELWFCWPSALCLNQKPIWPSREVKAEGVCHPHQCAASRAHWVLWLSQQSPLQSGWGRAALFPSKWWIIPNWYNRAACCAQFCFSGCFTYMTWNHSLKFKLPFFSLTDFLLSEEWAGEWKSKKTQNCLNKSYLILVLAGLSLLLIEQLYWKSKTTHAN